MSRPTIAHDIRDIAAAYDCSGRTDQPIRIYASASTISKATKDASDFVKVGEQFFFGLNQIVLLQK